ncbi:CopY/TcrY family copper transport repressor [Lentilactobacillus sp. IMAU92037]|uniref:CopY/TcrY family copper transport repressor n=1 Tax=Lentilactobacillus dabitei TaxID=2831523 RepID=UPI001C2C63B3|nr:CopY/TcrY family copper transport repressor [Lentilactobacillus dabitei]MBV0930213.1 CopY/TcrY family copper transport repressor [Lentilactobacillus dabitei]
MKDAKNETITDSEWEVMRAIWTMGKTTSRELIDAMNQLQGWSDSTTKTLLHRLINKGAVVQSGTSRPFVFKPIVGEKESMAAAATDLFDHMCAMRAGSTIAGVIKTRELSQADIAELQAILTEKAKTAPEQVQCNCLPGHHMCEEVEEHGQ